MRKLFAGVLLGLWLLGASSASAKPLVADLSQYRILIDARFTGTRLFLFGSRNETGDIVIVVRGPERSFTVRKKERILGLWINRQTQHFEKVPLYYALASSRRLDEMRDTQLFKPLGIGLNALILQDRPSDAQPFADAILRDGTSRRLYNSWTRPISFMGESLFKLVLPFPDTIPQGDYSAEVYLIDDGKLTSLQSIPLQVQSTGLDAWISNAAAHHDVSYGLFAVLIALALGWGVGRLLQRFQE